MDTEARLAAMVAAGDITEEHRQHVLANLAKNAGGAETLGWSETDLAARALERLGFSAAQVLARLRVNGLDGTVTTPTGDTVVIRDLVNAEVELEKQEQARAAAVAEANSPEARLAVAKAAEAARAEQARTAQLARVYLDTEYERLGLPPDAGSLLSDSEAVELAFGDHSNADTLQANIAATRGQS